MEGALAEASRLTNLLRLELDSMLDLVGTNQDMRTLLDCAAVAWDWTLLCEVRPGVRHTANFKNVCRILEPAMRHSQFPDGAAFATVRKECITDPVQLRAQYLILLGRVRAARQAGERATSGYDVGTGVPPSVVAKSRKWTKVAAIYTRPVMVFVSVSISLRHFLRRVGESCPSEDEMVICQKVGFIISLCLGEDSKGRRLPLRAYEDTCHRPACVWPQRASRRRRHSESSQPSFCAMEGCIALASASATEPPKLVYVVRVVKEVDVASVAATIDTEPWFAIGARTDWSLLGLPAQTKLRSVCSWYACKVHHRCRLLWTPEAPCEGVGSYIRLLHDPLQQQTPQRIADCVSLAAAGVSFRGGARDEQLADTVLHLLESTSKYKMHAMVVRRNGMRVDPTEEVAEKKQRDHMLEERRLATLRRTDARSVDCLKLQRLAAAQFPGVASAKALAAAIRERHAEAIPRQLPPTVLEEIRKRKRTDLVEALPRDVSHLHAVQKGTTRSVLRMKTSSWEESEQGRRWMHEKSKLVKADDDT